MSDHGLAIVRARLGAAADDVHWLVADLLAWRPHRRFAGWHDRAVFHFLTEPDDRARYRAVPCRAVLDDTLAADGVLVIATFAEDGPRACSGLPTVGYSADELLTSSAVRVAGASLRAAASTMSRPAASIRRSPGWRYVGDRRTGCDLSAKIRM